METLRRLSPALYALSVVLSLACASSPGVAASRPSTSTSPDPNPSSSRGASDVISRQELADPSVTGLTVLDAVRRLRPWFLTERTAGTGSFSGRVMASVDGINLLLAHELGRIAAVDASEIRYLSSSDAVQRFGARGTMGGVILVTLRH